MATIASACPVCCSAWSSTTSPASSRCTIRAGQADLDLLLGLAGELWAVEVQAQPADAGMLVDAPPLRLLARLEHRVDALGSRLEEPDDRRMLPTSWRRPACTAPTSPA